MMRNKERGLFLREEKLSEAFLTSALLAFSGGFQDAYTFFSRDHVFSNAQTGNIVQMSAHLMNGEWMAGVRYLFPLAAFIFGIIVAEYFHIRHSERDRIHWRQIVLLSEIVILFGVGFVPQSENMLATSLVSFTCAMQVQTFRKVRGYSYASTMCIGNLRSGTDFLQHFLQERKPGALRAAFYYYAVIFWFAVGAGAGAKLAERWNFRAIWVSCIVLFCIFLLLFWEKQIDTEEKKSEQEENRY